MAVSPSASVWEPAGASNGAVDDTCDTARTPVSADESLLIKVIDLLSVTTWHCLCMCERKQCIFPIRLSMKAEGFKKMTAHWLSRHHCDACRIRSCSLLQRQLPYMPNTSDQEGIPIPLISWRQLPESGDGMRGIMDSMRYRQWPHLQYDFIQQLSERAEERRRGVLCREMNCLSLRSEDATLREIWIRDSLQGWNHCDDISGSTDSTPSVEAASVQIQLCKASNPHITARNQKARRAKPSQEYHGQSWAKPLPH